MTRSNFVGCAFTLLYHLPELVQRAQIIRPWLVSESLRPVGPRHLADIEVTVAGHRKPVRRQELGWTKARAKPAQSGNALPCVVDNGAPRAEVRHIAAHRLHGAEFADVADRALAGWHEQAARTVQVVPLRLVLTFAVEHLHAMARGRPHTPSR